MRKKVKINNKQQMQPTGVEPGMYNMNQVCTRCNFSRTTLRIMLKTKNFPRHTQVVGESGKRWPVEVVDDWRFGRNNPVGPGRPRSEK